jgi:hypothetical protein
LAAPVHLSFTHEHLTLPHILIVVSRNQCWHLRSVMFMPIVGRHVQECRRSDTYPHSLPIVVLRLRRSSAAVPRNNAPSCLVTSSDRRVEVQFKGTSTHPRKATPAQALYLRRR